MMTSRVFRPSMSAIARRVARDGPIDRSAVNVAAIAEFVSSRPKACEICGTVAELELDHDHVSGFCRGWLCRFCNGTLLPDAYRGS
jgi:hypothetical protein